MTYEHYKQLIYTDVRAAARILMVARTSKARQIACTVDYGSTMVMRTTNKTPATDGKRFYVQSNGGTISLSSNLPPAQ